MSNTNTNTNTNTNDDASITSTNTLNRTLRKRNQVISYKEIGGQISMSKAQRRQNWGTTGALSYLTDTTNNNYPNRTKGKRRGKKSSSSENGRLSVNDGDDNESYDTNLSTSSSPRKRPMKEILKKISQSEQDDDCSMITIESPLKKVRVNVMHSKEKKKKKSKSDYHDHDDAVKDDEKKETIKKKKIKKSSSSKLSIATKTSTQSQSFPNTQNQNQIEKQKDRRRRRSKEDPTYRPSQDDSSADNDEDEELELERALHETLQRARIVARKQHKKHLRDEAYKPEMSESSEDEHYEDFVSFQSKRRKSKKKKQHKSTSLEQTKLERVKVETQGKIPASNTTHQMRNSVYKSSVHDFSPVIKTDPLMKIKNEASISSNSMNVVSDKLNTASRVASAMDTVCTSVQNAYENEIEEKVMERDTTILLRYKYIIILSFLAVTLFIAGYLLSTPAVTTIVQDSIQLHVSSPSLVDLHDELGQTNTSSVDLKNKDIALNDETIIEDIYWKKSTEEDVALNEIVEKPRHYNDDEQSGEEIVNEFKLDSDDTEIQLIEDCEEEKSYPKETEEEDMGKTMSKLQQEENDTNKQTVDIILDDDDENIKDVFPYRSDEDFSQVANQGEEVANKEYTNDDYVSIIEQEIQITNISVIVDETFNDDQTGDSDAISDDTVKQHFDSSSNLNKELVELNLKDKIMDNVFIAGKTFNDVKAENSEINDATPQLHVDYSSDFNRELNLKDLGIDYAAISSGARIIYSDDKRYHHNKKTSSILPTSPSLKDNLPYINRLLSERKNKFYGYPPEAALRSLSIHEGKREKKEDDVALGECWAFSHAILNEDRGSISSGALGNLSIELPSLPSSSNSVINPLLRVTAVVIEHPLDKSSQPQSAIQDFRVLAYHDNEAIPVYLGTFTYNILDESHNRQVFFVKQTSIDENTSHSKRISAVTLAIDSNWGHDYSCLYRFSLYGESK